MFAKWTVVVSFMFFTAALCVDDLLDEYVRHVGESNKNRNSNSSNGRNKRAVQQEMLWTHSEMLDDIGDVVLRWQPRHQEIAFKVEAKTRGYLGIGFSPSGGMRGADIVIGWVDDNSGQAFLLDCHASEQKPESIPVRDEAENYTLMRGYQNDTHTVLEFRRALDTCDPEDFVLSGDTVRVIWALHKSDPPHNLELPHHGTRRGEQSLYLLSPPPAPLPEVTRPWDISLKNFRIPDDTDTVYWCKIFKAPTLNSKHHIVGAEPIVGFHHRAHLHHMLLHECDISATRNHFLQWEKYTNEEGAPCYSNEMPELWEACLTPLLAWAAGSKGETLPPHVGLPLGDKTTSPYYMLEIHFDNPSKRTATDSSGLRVHYTSQLRQYDGGMMVTGVTISSLHVIPPRQPEYKTAGYCSTDCTKEVFPKDGVNIVSVLLHSHLAGRKLNLRHIRGGRELSPIAEDNHYDFNYQQSRLLGREVTVLPGDMLVTECTYSTAKRDTLTVGGYSTSQEMCLAFIMHYPRIQLAGCYSMPPVKYFFETFGVREFYDKDMQEVKAMFLRTNTEAHGGLTPPEDLLPTFAPGFENSAEENMRVEQAIKQARYYTVEGEGDPLGGPLDQLIIKEPQEFRNKSFISHLNEIPWKEPLLTKRIEESFNMGQHLTFCRKRDDTLAIPEKIEIPPKFTPYVDNITKMQCSYRLQHSSSTNQIEPLQALTLFMTFWYIYLANFLIIHTQC